MKNFFRLILVLSIIFSENVFAKVLQLQEQPKVDSKIIGTIDTATGIITIFNPQDGSGWIKVADPRNGNVGWVKAADVGNAGFSFNVMTSGEGPAKFQVIQYGSGKPYTAEQISTMMKKMQSQQEAVQRDMDLMMRDMFQNINQWVTFPIIMPVVPTPIVSPAPPNKTVINKPLIQPATKQPVASPPANTQTKIPATKNP